MDSSARAWAVIVAAGRAERFDAEKPKQFAPLAGRPLVLWSLEPFLTHPAIRGATLVVPDEYVAQPPPWMTRLAGEGVQIAAGGKERSDSVRLGLATVPKEVEWVAVHDGARPLISREAIGSLLAHAAPGRGVVAGRRVTDSLKEADGAGRIVAAVNRERLWRAETPQLFPRELILDVHRRAEADRFSASDCAGLCERYGVEVVLVEIAEPNLKVTHPRDLELAEALLLRRTGATATDERAARR